MKKVKLDPLAERPNLDFSKGVRGKYARIPKQYTKAVLLDADLQKTFPDSSSVNRALRAMLEITRHTEAAGLRSAPTKKTRAVA